VKILPFINAFLTKAMRAS